MKIKCLLISGLVLMVLFLPKEVFASSNSIGIYPLIIHLITSPNKHTSTPINITNYSTTKQKVLLRALPFTGSQNGINPITYVPNTKPIQVSQLSFKKIELLDMTGGPISSLELEPLQTQQVILSVTAYQNFDHRDYYFSFIALTSPSPDSKSISTVLGVSSTVLISVDPQAPQVSLSRFSSPSFFISGPVPFSIRLTNNGNSLAQASGKIVIKNFLGQKVSEVTIPQTLLLAKSSRILSDGTTDNLTWNEKFLFGLYSADLKLNVGRHPVIRSQRHFVAIPLLVLLITTAILIFIINIYLRVIKRLQK